MNLLLAETEAELKLIAWGIGLVSVPLVSAIGYLWKQHLKTSEEQRKQAEKTQKQWEDCEKGHTETKVELAELRGRLDAGGISRVVQATIEALRKHEDTDP